MKISDKAIALACGAAIVAVCFSSEAKAQDGQLSVIVHTASKHSATPDDYKFNEVNPGAALKLQLNQDWSLQAGGYRNSYYKPTVYAVAQYTPLHIGNVSVGAFAGLASGYAHVSQLNVGKVSVVGGFYAVAQFDNLSVAVRAVPKITPKQAGVATLEFGYAFK